MQEKESISRRKFVGSAATAALAFSIVPRHVLGGPGFVAPSDKISLGYIGMGTQGLRELPRVLEDRDVQVVSVCDPNTDSADYVDWSRNGLRNQMRRFLDDPSWGGGVDGIRAGREVGREVTEAYYAKNKPSGKYSGCTTYADFREMLEKEDIDGVKIMTPDHLHSTIAIAAMKKGLHVVMHKPIGNFLDEALLTIRTAGETGVATHLLAWNNRDSVHLVRDWIDAGAIGTLREIHNWINKPIWPQWPTRPEGAPPVPDGFDWDLWLGPALYRPYHPHYTHAVFRGWYDFGSGILGDMGHYSLLPVFEAFELGAPESVEATPSFTCKIENQVSGWQENDVSFPIASTMRFGFPARGNRPAVDICWYDGGMRPHTPPEIEQDNEEMPSSGMMFVGDKGRIIADFLCDEPRIIPSSAREKIQSAMGGSFSSKAPGGPSWTESFKGAGKSPGSFDSAAVSACAEMVCLGAVALRTGRKIRWDTAQKQVSNIPEANSYLRREFREGWEL